MSYRLNLRHTERCLGLPQRYLDDLNNLALPETQILLKMIESMPFLLEIAEGGFNEILSSEILQREATRIRAEINMRDVVE